MGGGGLINICKTKTKTIQSGDHGANIPADWEFMHFELSTFLIMWHGPRQFPHTYTQRGDVSKR